MELREIYYDLDKPEIELILKKIINLINNNLNSNDTSFFINIPSFDYSPFKNSTVAINENNTSFGLARHLKNNLSHKKYDIYWDPVFKIFSYPGSGNLLNDKSPIYYPFTKGTTLLNKESFCIFTEDAFQISNIMQIEAEFFGNNHPYRRKKIFNFYNKTSNKNIEFHYWVRPKNDLVNYDLDKLKELIIGNKIATKLKPSNILMVNFNELSKFIKEELTKDSFFLLSNKTKKYLKLDLKTNKFPDNLF